MSRQLSRPLQKNRLSWHRRRFNLVAAVVNLASVQRFHLGWRCDCDKADNRLFGGRCGICVLQPPSLPLQTFTFKMLSVVCLVSLNVSGSTDETNQINTLPPVVSGRAESFLVFHGFPPSPLYDGGERTSMVPKTKCQKDVYCTVYPSLILPAIPFSLCTIPFSFLCVCIPVPPCLPGFPCFFFFFFFFLSSTLYLPLLSLVLRTCRWHGAWPDKVIPQCRGLPGRDSLDTVSPLLARFKLQREGRRTPSEGVRRKGRENRGKREEVERKRTGTGALRNQKMEPMFKCKKSSSI